jgi:MFS family permease
MQPTKPAPEAHDPYAALRHRDYRLLLAGNVLASVANEMQSVAVGWELYERTQDALALGLVGLAQFVPVFLLSLPAGHAADRYSRKALVVAARALAALASLGLAALSFLEGPIPLVYACLFLTGVCQAYSAPARWALVPSVVPDHALENAITWNSSGWQIASMLGPALGGFVIAALGQAAGAYLLACFFSLACAALVAGLRPRPMQRHTGAASLASLLAGVRFVWQNKLIMATITLDLFAVLLGGATALLPVFASEILHVGPVGLGWLRAAPSMGALAMAVLLAHLPPMRRAGPTLLLAVSGFGAATVVFGLSENFALSFAMLAVTGALDNISVVVRGTLVQVLTPDPMRGRVSAVNAIFIGSSNELGAFESGATAQLFGGGALGSRRSVLFGGIGTVVVVLAVAWVWPQVLRLRSLYVREGLGYPEREGAAVAEEGE